MKYFSMMFAFILPCFAFAQGGQNQFARPDELPNVDDQTRTITACEDGEIPVAYCYPVPPNQQECVVGCAFPDDESE